MSFLGSLWDSLKKLNLALAAAGQKPASPAPIPVPVAPSPAPAPQVPAAPAPSASFDIAVTFTLQNEGGYSDIPQDAGGPTNYGIVESDLSSFLGHSVTADDIKNLSLDTAKAIYKANYWNPAFEQLSQPVATAIFDWGVLHGPTSSQKLAQNVANGLGASLVCDGVIGPASVAAINAIPADKFVAAFANAMKSWFASDVAGNPSQKIFLAGWNARADRIAALA